MMLKPHVTRARERRVGDGRPARKTLRVEHRELGCGDSSAGAPVPRTPAFAVIARALIFHVTITFRR